MIVIGIAIIPARPFPQQNSIIEDTDNDDSAGQGAVFDPHEKVLRVLLVGIGKGGGLKFHLPRGGHIVHAKEHLAGRVGLVDAGRGETAGRELRTILSKTKTGANETRLTAVSIIFIPLQTGSDLVHVLIGGGNAGRLGPEGAAQQSQQEHCAHDEKRWTEGTRQTGPHGMVLRVFMAKEAHDC